MPEPKKKTSQSKSRIRRGSHIKQIKRSVLVACPKCKEKILPHRICPNCGYYKDEMIIDVAEKEKKKKQAKEESEEENE